MNAALAELLRANVNRGLIVDANLLLLFFVGEVDRALIPRFERTRGYGPEDYRDVAALMVAFGPRLLTTPHVLTEVSNLANKLKGEQRERFYRVFAEGVQTMAEVPLIAREVVSRPLFSRLGLTDLGILDAARGSALVLTDDGPLAGHLRAEGVAAFTLNDLRAVRGGRR